MPGFPDLTDRLLNDPLLYLGDPESAPGTFHPTPDPHLLQPGGGRTPVRYWSGYGLQPSIISPPWTTMTAYDLNQGVIKWRIPLGNAPQGAAKISKTRPS